MNARTLCERAELILKFGFPSHEQCYWNCGEYRVRCDQAGGKDTCIGPKFFVEIVDTTNNLGDGEAGVYAFDVLATDNYKIAFPQHLYRIRDRNAIAEQEKKEASSRKRASSTWPKEAAKSSRVASRQLVDGAAAPTEQALKRAGVHTAKQYRESTQRVKDASSMNAVRAVLASVRAPSGPTPATNQPSKRALSCSSQSKSAPAAKAVTPWRPTLSQASSSRDGGQAASQPPDPQPTALDTLNRDWRASSSWDGGQVALNNYVNQQPAHRSSYFHGDLQVRLFPRSR